MMILVLLFPLILYYEFGAVFVLNEAGEGSPLVARTMISTLFGIFGVAGLHLPAVLLIAALLAQHLLSRDSWRVSPRWLGVMVGESLLWCLPILVMGGVLGVITLGATTELGLTPLEASVISVGAGLYEELVFRLAIMVGIHALLVEICGVKSKIADWLAAAASAVAFAAYHGLGPGGSLDGAVALFYLGAGLLLAWLFLTRGFGIAAGAHTAYDLVVLLLLPGIIGNGSAT